MELDAFHELTAAYALDALTEREEREYEGHLSRCEGCRADLAAFSETAAALAYAVEGPAPAPALRDRLLERAAAERTNVVPLRRRWALPAAVSAAAAAAAVAIGIGIWASSLSGDLHGANRDAARQTTLIEILSDPHARRVPVLGGSGRLVVSPAREAAVVLDRVQAAPDGKTYELWVIDRGKPRSAGLFLGGSGREAVTLTRTVPEHAVVAATVEPAGGVSTPSGPLLFSTRAA